MGTARDQLRNFGIVVNVGKSKTRFAIRNDIQQVQPTISRNVAGLYEPGDGGIATLAIRSDRLFFNCGQSTFGVAWRKTGVPHLLVVMRCLFDRYFQFVAKSAVIARADMASSSPIISPVSSKIEDRALPH